MLGKGGGKGRGQYNQSLQCQQGVETIEKKCGDKWQQIHRQDTLYGTPISNTAASTGLKNILTVNTTHSLYSLQFCRPLDYKTSDCPQVTEIPHLPLTQAAEVTAQILEEKILVLAFRLLGYIAEQALNAHQIKKKTKELKELQLPATCKVGVFKKN